MDHAFAKLWVKIARMPVHRPPTRALVRAIVCRRPALLSEDSCEYRYKFDNLIELTATWEAADGNGVEGQVSVTQLGGAEEEGSSKLQISVFLTVANRQEGGTDALKNIYFFDLIWSMTTTVRVRYAKW